MGKGPHQPLAQACSTPLALVVRHQWLLALPLLLSGQLGVGYCSALRRLCAGAQLSERGKRAIARTKTL